MQVLKIVFCRYRNVCEPDFINAFRALGIDVVEVFLNETGATSLEEQAEYIGSKIVSATPMFVFSINYFPYVSIVCQSLKVFYVSVSVTCPMVEIYNTTIRNSFNRVFLFDREQYLSVKAENPQGIFYLPLGADVGRLDNTLGDESGFDYDVSFVGSLYNEKDPFLSIGLSENDKERYEQIIAEQIKASVSGQELLEGQIYDSDVELIKRSASDFYPSDLSVRNIDRFVAVNNYLSPHMTYIERVEILNEIAKECNETEIHLFTNSDTRELTGVVCHGGVNTITEMPFVFRKSRINQNLTPRSIKTGLPQSIWDVLGSGGFMLTNWQGELPELLEIGKHLDAYEDRKELIEKIKYYLDHDDERMEIAHNGYEFVKATGTTLCRVIAIVKTIAG